MPFIIFLFWAREEKDHTKDKRIQEVLLNSFEISFCFSLGIETCQLFLKIGTFQLTDLFFIICDQYSISHDFLLYLQAE